MRRFALLLLLAAPAVLLLVAVLPTERSVSWFAPDDTLIDECPVDSIECLSQAFANFAYRSGGRVALAELELRTSPGSTLEIECHRLVHAVGGAVYARTLDLGAAFLEGGAVCGYGFYHGIVERALIYEDLDPSEAADACGGLSGPDDRDQCSHGAGHALGISGTPSDAAARCDVFANADPGVSRYSCYEGAFMEGFLGILGASRWSDGAVLCIELPEDIQQSCHAQAAVALLNDPQSGGWEAAARSCESLAGTNRISCIEGWSSQIAGKEGWKEICDLAGKEIALCVKTAGEMEAVFRSPDRAKAIETCMREFDADNPLLDACAEGVGKRIDRTDCQLFFSSQAIVACRRGYDSVEH